jgi:prevent-host-death family protein
LSWTLANAKDHLSELVRRANEDGPQEITVRGRAAAVLISPEEYAYLRDPDRPKTLNEFLKSIPPLEDLDLSRNPLPSRDVDLE